MERILLLSPRLVMQFYNQSAAEASECSPRHGWRSRFPQLSRRRDAGGAEAGAAYTVTRFPQPGDSLAFCFWGVSVCFLVVFSRANRIKQTPFWASSWRSRLGNRLRPCDVAGSSLDIHPILLIRKIYLLLYQFTLPFWILVHRLGLQPIEWKQINYVNIIFRTKALVTCVNIIFITRQLVVDVQNDSLKDRHLFSDTSSVIDPYQSSIFFKLFTIFSIHVNIPKL